MLRPVRELLLRHGRAQRRILAPCPRSVPDSRSRRWRIKSPKAKIPGATVTVDPPKRSSFPRAVIVVQIVFDGNCSHCRVCSPWRVSSCPVKTQLGRLDTARRLQRCLSVRWEVGFRDPAGSRAGNVFRPAQSYQDPGGGVQSSNGKVDHRA